MIHFYRNLLKGSGLMPVFRVYHQIRVICHKLIKRKVESQP